MSEPDEHESEDEAPPRPDLDPDAWDANLADDEHFHPPETTDPRGFAGEDEGSTEGSPRPGAR